jgi:alkylated DNA repair dioxygenase AlkB
MASIGRKTIKTLHPPEGFRYSGNFITPEEEAHLIEHFQTLPFKEFEFHGYFGKRRTTSFGWHYNFGSAALERANPIPDFLLPFRSRAAEWADLKTDDLQHILVTEYTPGSPIGWHRDRDVFEDVIGVSLGSVCVFRFRRKTPSAWERHSLILNPRSVYLLRGPSRFEWEHSIPEVQSLRYSITFRSFRDSAEPL